MQAVALGVSGADLFGALAPVVVALLSVARAANRVLALEGYSVTLGSVLPGSTADKARDEVLVSGEEVVHIYPFQLVYLNHTTA